jgi:hypothetical protein
MLPILCTVGKLLRFFVEENVVVAENTDDWQHGLGVGA